MSSSINFSNHQWLTRALDTDRNGVMNELQASENIFQQVDTDANGELSRQEVTVALQQDRVEIQNGELKPFRGDQIYVEGLETLRNVHEIADDHFGVVIDSTIWSDDTPEEAYQKLRSDNRDYTRVVERQSSALRSIRDMTEGKTDSRSKAIHSQASQALRSTSFHRWMNYGSSIFGSDVDSMESANTHLRIAKNTLRSTLNAIESQTADLPDVKQRLQATDRAVSRAFSNMAAIENHSSTPQQVKSKLMTEADATEASAGGRTLNWGIAGSVLGAAGGAAIGYFAGGQDLKNAAIGAGIGLAAGGGTGAIMGNSKDNALLNTASSLRELAGEVEAYDPAQARGALLKEVPTLYSQGLSARGHMNLDEAQVHDQSIASTGRRVGQITDQSQRVIDAYRK